MKSIVKSYKNHVMNFKISSSWKYVCDLTNSRFQLHEFNFMYSCFELHETLYVFKIMNSSRWNREFKKLKYWIHEVEIMNSWSWIVNSWSWNLEFMKLKSWIHEVEMWIREDEPKSLKKLKCHHQFFTRNLEMMIHLIIIINPFQMNQRIQITWYRLAKI
jgi:hypothetical protein